MPVAAPSRPDPSAAAAACELREPLLAFIARRTPDRDTAEDILQDVLLRVHRHAGELEHAPALHGWIYRIARNAIADHYRRAAVRREHPAARRVVGEEAGHGRGDGFIATIGPAAARSASLIAAASRSPPSTQAHTGDA